VSNFVGAALSTTTLRKNELGIYPGEWSEAIIFESWVDVFGVQTYQTAWWPGNRGFFGGQGVDMSCLYPVQRWQYYLAQGSMGRFGIRGTTRDRYGSALAGVTVKLFKTATDEKVAEVVSDGNGAFLVTTPYYPDAHYMVQYKAGTPDVFGSSPNTLIAS
jgi:hypothetical protein